MDRLKVLKFGFMAILVVGAVYIGIRTSSIMSAMIGILVWALLVGAPIVVIKEVEKSQ